jgi:16S rRNA (guanine527-N7)-methyltransferase
MGPKNPTALELASFISNDPRTANLSDEKRERILNYYEFLCSENAVQNLTRLEGPEDFFYFNLVDTVSLLNSGLVEYPAMDLGSGGGAPGLIASIIDSESRWILAESESGKAAFLMSAITLLGLGDRVEVFRGRGEDFLRSKKVNSVVCRAVGTVEKILGWIGPCSTWNNLILMKGPKWSEERELLNAGRLASKYSEETSWTYRLNASSPDRVVSKIVRVPRGTKLSEG